MRARFPRGRTRAPGSLHKKRAGTLASLPAATDRPGRSPWRGVLQGKGPAVYHANSAGMCGRYSLAVDPALILNLFPGLAIPAGFLPRYNIAPTQDVLAVWSDGIRQVGAFRWGLVPGWAKEPRMAASLINARAESVAEKAAFRDAFRQRRCLVLADGFYEWKPGGVGQRKQPFYVQRSDGAPFAFAGLWERWAPPGADPRGSEALRTCTIITTAANAFMQPLHDRMPVIVDPQRYDAWLDPSCQDRPRLQDLLKAQQAPDLVARRVSPVVNDVRVDSADCIAAPADDLWLPM